MRITIAAVGRGRDDPAQELFERYAARLKRGPLGPVALTEIDLKGSHPPAEARRREGERLRAAVPEGARLVALDARGKSLDSADFAKRLARWRDQGAAEVAFLIGGAEGLDPALRRDADLVLSLGPMTWPHLLVRALLAEQLFRAASILTGHPYHRP
jgi:23S rRNA (pseudouridine1915-N3)-methyltransferase